MARPRKVVKPEAEAAVAVAEPVVAPVVEAPKVVKPVFDPASMREKNVHATDAERIAESRKALLSPIEPGQKFFEAPDGYIIIGEADKAHVFDRRNGGSWINPRR